MAKDFNKVNLDKRETGINTGAVYDSIERGRSSYGAQGTASPEEAEQRKAAGRTQGRKGCKAARINTAYTTENYQYICVMSKLTGQTLTDFVNACIAAHRSANPEIYEKAKDLIAQIDGKEAE